jgi:hypothetical protein
MRVTLSYPTSRTKEVLLAGIPRKGEHILLENGPDAPTLVVESVTWVEGTEDPPKPTVIVAVRERQ